MSALPNYLLTFELSKNKDQVFIHTDENGIKFLIDELSKLLENVNKNETDHLHLMTKEWGGNELSAESQGDEI